MPAVICIVSYVYDRIGDDAASVRYYDEYTGQVMDTAILSGAVVGM